MGPMRAVGMVRSSAWHYCPTASSTGKGRVRKAGKQQLLSRQGVDERYEPMTYAFINQSVGKYGKNIKEDVMSIQIRLNRWIMEGKLPDVPMLAVDGDCGPLTRKGI